MKKIINNSKENQTTVTPPVPAAASAPTDTSNSLQSFLDMLASVTEPFTPAASRPPRPSLTQVTAAQEDPAVAALKQKRQAVAGKMRDFIANEKLRNGARVGGIYSQGARVLARSEFTLDEQGNARIDLKPVVDALTRGILGLPEMTGNNTRSAAISTLGEEGVNYLDYELRRIVMERYMPEYAGVYPLNTMKLRPDVLDELNGKIVGRIKVTISPYEHEEHARYLNHPRVKGNPQPNANPNDMTMVVHADDVAQLRKSFVVHGAPTQQAKVTPPGVGR